LQTRIDDFRNLDTDVLAISVDDVDRNREVADAYSPDVRVLSDPELAAIDAYGVRHPGGGLEGDIARPAVFLVDRDGRIAWRKLTENWRVRPRPDELLVELSRLNAGTP
jgi:peroxiredoxin